MVFERKEELGKNVLERLLMLTNHFPISQS